MNNKYILYYWADNGFNLSFELFTNNHRDHLEEFKKFQKVKDFSIYQRVKLWRFSEVNSAKIELRSYPIDELIAILDAHQIRHETMNQEYSEKLYEYLAGLKSITSSIEIVKLNHLHGDTNCAFTFEFDDKDVELMHNLSV